MISHYSVKFNGHGHCGSGDINTPTNTVILANARSCICSISMTAVYARSNMTSERACTVMDILQMKDAHMQNFRLTKHF